MPITKEKIAALEINKADLVDGKVPVTQLPADQTLAGLGGIAHSLATAINDFLMASGAGAFVKKTLAEAKTILDWVADIATHAALATGIHGVGASTVESATGSQAKVDAHKDLTTGVHGAGASTIETIVGSQGKVDTHAGLTAPHSSTSAATADRIALRDASGRTKFAAPAASGDALIKGTRLTATEMLDGTLNYVLTAQGAGVNPVYAAVTAAKISSGSYTGDGTANRAIPHGLGIAPKLVIIVSSSQPAALIIAGLANTVSIYPPQTSSFWLAVTAPNATNFYVGNDIDYGASVNFTAAAYYWVAIG